MRFARIRNSTFGLTTAGSVHTRSIWKEKKKNENITCKKTCHRACLFFDTLYLRSSSVPNSMFLRSLTDFAPTLHRLCTDFGTEDHRRKNEGRTEEKSRCKGRFKSNEKEMWQTSSPSFCMIDSVRISSILAYGKFYPLFFGFSAFFCYLCPRFHRKRLGG